MVSVLEAILLNQCNRSKTDTQLNRHADTQFRLMLVVALFWQTKNQKISPELEGSSSFFDGNFLRCSSHHDFGVHPVISPYGSNSFELKKRRKLARIEVVALLVAFFFKIAVHMFDRNIG